MVGWSALLIGLYSLAVVAASIFGGWVPSLIRLTHVRMQIVLSFVGGLMLGVGMLHMVPHSYVQIGSLDRTLMWTMVGLLGMFFLIRTFHFHQHGPAAPEESTDADVDEIHAVGEHAGHDHHHHPEQPGGHRLSWLGVALGLSLHSFMDGIAMAAAVVSESGHSNAHQWAGMGVFLAVLLHKPLDALSVTTLMQASGWTRRWQQVVNAGFALMCPVGAWGFVFGVRYFGTDQSYLVGVALALSAGVFLCISLSDLLPEVQFHQHDRFKLSAALLIGVFAAYGIRFLEPAHVHQEPHRHSEEIHRHDDGLHDHDHRNAQ